VSPTAVILVDNGESTENVPWQVETLVTHEPHYAHVILLDGQLLHALVDKEGERFEISHDPSSTVRGFKHSEVNFSHFKCGNNHQEDMNDILVTLDIDPIKTNPPPFSGPFPLEWENCRPDQQTTKKELIGILIDNGAYIKAGATTAKVQALVANLLLAGNYVYKNQLNVLLTLNALVIQTSVGGPLWNYSPTTCPSNINVALQTLATWRRQNTQWSVSLWQQMTACFQPPGVVGISYVDVLCDNSYGVSLISTFDSNWVLSLHELTHGHGAIHPFDPNNPSTIGNSGGIMDYSDGKYPPHDPNGLYQIDPGNKPRVCNALTKALSGQCLSNQCVPTNECFQNEATTSVCGNGKLEPGEQCDAGNQNGGACCTLKCKLKAGVLCAGGECCNMCIPRLAKQLCHSPSNSPTNPNGQGYCGPNATCITNPPCVVCGADSCMLRCMVNGVCSPSNFKVVDGSVCLRNPLRLCLNGQCAS
jgi:cysteine-rich repeat protein